MISVREASERTGVKIRTIRSWIEKGKIRYVKDEKTGRILIFDSEIEKVEGGTMAVRNFWVEVDIDGYKTEMKGGPRNKQGGGGMEITLLQRNKGSKEVAFIINSYESNGVLYTNVMDKDRKVITTFETER